MHIILVTVTVIVSTIVAIIVAMKGAVLTCKGGEQVGIGVILCFLLLVVVLIVVIVNFTVVFGGGVVQDRRVGDCVRMGRMHT